jgi:hypothetical protein
MRRMLLLLVCLAVAGCTAKQYDAFMQTVPLPLGVLVCALALTR